VSRDARQGPKGGEIMPGKSRTAKKPASKPMEAKKKEMKKGCSH
jgi:hypothetical protein